MHKKYAVLAVVAVCTIFAGCQQQELSATSASDKSQKAKGYVETLADTHKQAQEKIGEAVNMQNEKNAEAAQILENDSQDNNSMSTITMENIPAQIDMSLAQTCHGATLKTNKGDITLKFYNTDAPVSVANFCTIAQKGDYDGVIFHRVIKDFMIQGGDPEGTGMGGPGYKFDDEIHANNKNNVGTIAMANAGPGTNGSQFFINTNANNFLDTKHTVFGQVTEGMDVVTAIENVETGAQDKPVTDVVIESIVLDMN